MKRSLVQDMVTCMTIFPSRNETSSDLLPAAIIPGYPKKVYNKFKNTFVSYEQVYIRTKNSTKQRTLGEIAMCPENEQGGNYFILLATGK